MEETIHWWLCALLCLYNLNCTVSPDYFHEFSVNYCTQGKISIKSAVKHTRTLDEIETHSIPKNRQNNPDFILIN